MAAGEDILTVLRSIDTTLKAMLALAQQRTATARSTQAKPVASARELDGRYGNPVVKFNPRDWTGPSFKDAKFSDCPPDFLDLLAETFDYFAQKAEKKNETTDKGTPVAEFKRADAARARGWAARIRSGAHVPDAAGHNGTGQGASWAESGGDWS